VIVSEDSLRALFLTIKLAGVVTFFLLLLGMPLAWWLARTSSRAKEILATVVAMPLVLPPSVLGFYLLLAMGPRGPIGKITSHLGWEPLPFTFSGLVLGSLFYSLPFMVQPLQAAFEQMGVRPLEVAATLRASPLDRFLTVVLPLSLPGIVAACVMTFAHTVGEFGVVLMLGGNLPGITRVASVQIFEHVESLEYAEAHGLSMVMLAFSFVTLLVVRFWSRKQRERFHG
jgi:molybdate transport system permease protein